MKNLTIFLLLLSLSLLTSCIEAEATKVKKSSKGGVSKVSEKVGFGGMIE